MDLIKPIQFSQFFMTFFALAALITCATLYAILYTLANLQQSTRLMFFAYLSYLCLFVCVVYLSNALNFEGVWFILSLLLLLGYFFGPKLMLKLCVATHHHEDLLKKGNGNE